VIPVDLDELGPRAELPLTLEQGRALAASGVVTAVPSAYRPGAWLIGPAGKPFQVLLCDAKEILRRHGT